MTKSTSIVFILLFAVLFRLESKVILKFFVDFNEKKQTDFCIFSFSRGSCLLSLL